MKLPIRETPLRRVINFALMFLVAWLLVDPVTADANEPPSFQGNLRPYTIMVSPYPAPLVSWQKPKGGLTNISRYKGNIVLLNFWATWCPACLFEMPDLDKLESTIGNPEFKVVTVNLDQTNGPIIERFFDRLNLKSLPLLSDPLSKSLEPYGIREGLPWTFLIDRSGDVRGYLMGAAHWLEPEGQSLIRYYLDE